MKKSFNNISWAPFPFIRFFVAYILGVILYIFTKISIPYLGFVLLLGIGIFGIVKLVIKDSNYHKINLLTGIFGLLLLFFSGIFLAEKNNQILSKNHFSKFEASTYLGKINQSISQKNNYFQTEIEINKVFSENKWIETEGKCIVNLKNIKSLDSITYGTELVFTKKPIEVQNSGNPFEFDYKAYLANNNVYHKIILQEDEFSVTGINPSNFVVEYSLKCADFLDKILKTYIHTPQELGIARALFLGIKDGIDNELRSSYSAAGAMHVLAVSGMHVAVLFQLLSMFLVRIPFFKKNQLVTNLILLVFVWFYAFITGGSASVLRAVVMFSFTIIAKIFDKRSNIYNTLAMSAFVLTLYNPFMIMDVGFLLSYLAVIGIVYIYPKINSWIVVDNKVVKWIWDITCISVAAQISTFPLSILFFHQFPTYFIVSNLFVIPVSMIAMYSGIALFFVSWIKPLAVIIGYLTEKSIWLMNYGIFISEKLPNSLIEGLFITVLECLILYLIIYLIVNMIQEKKGKLIYLISLLVFSYSVSSIIKTKDNNSKTEVHIFNNKTGFFAQIIENRNSILIVNDKLKENKNTIDYITKPLNLNYGIKNTKIEALNSEKNQIVRIGNAKILVVQTEVNQNLKEKDFDYVYWNYYSAKGIKYLAENNKIKKFIISSGLSQKMKENIVKSLNENALSFHLLEQKAFVFEL